MSIATRLNPRITQLAVGRHLPYRTVRMRLTLLYGGLFLLSGAALMAIAYALLVNAGFVFSLENGATAQPAGLVRGGLPSGLPRPGATTHPSSQTMAHWRGVAQCMRRHGVSRFPDPTTSVPRFGFLGQIDDRDGAVLVIPDTMDAQSSTFNQVATSCGLIDGEQAAQDSARRTQVRQGLLIQSGIALAGMSLLSLALGWLMAGRVLQPLEDAYHAQRQFVANASHELRAPLTRQRALIEVALASPEASVASLRRAHERVLASERHLEQLIDALLALTRGQAGLERREPLDLAAIAADALRARESEAAALDLDIRASLAPTPMAGDPRLIERLVVNLIDNAIRYNVRGGYVELTTDTPDRRPFLAVANAGPVVPTEHLDRLFKPFQRLGAARTDHTGGHGLGLSIVRAIAAAHRAELVTRARPEGGLAVEISFAAPTTSDQFSRSADQRPALPWPSST